MLLAVKRRFRALQTRYPIEGLADNASCFTAHETVAFAHAIGLVPCFTPLRSPQSNGIAESLRENFQVRLRSAQLDGRGHGRARFLV
jgi:transposase InsO family protein